MGNIEETKDRKNKKRFLGGIWVSLRGVMRLMYVIVLVIIVAAGAVYWALSNFGRTTDELHKLSNKKHLVADLQLALSQVVMPGNDYLLTGSSEEKELHAKLDRKVREAIVKVQEAADSDQETQLINEIAKEYESVRNIELQILSLPNPVGNVEGGKLMESIDDIADKLSVQAGELHEIIRAAETKAIQDADTKQQRILIVIAVGAFIAAGVGIFVSQAVKTNVIKPLMCLSETADKIAEGDLTKTEERCSASGEVGKLIGAFENMADSLRTLISGVVGSTQNVVSTSEELSATSGEAAKMVEQVADAMEEVAKGASKQATYVSSTIETVTQVNTSIQQIASGAHEQATSISITADMVNQMANSIQEVASSAQTVAHSAEKTREAADKGKNAVELTITGMDSIKNKVFETANKIRELGEHSQHIGEIIRVIDDIAEQTNLLALNAAIEAARAGEHGKGFAVVADEVRKLAERSSKATKEIADLITNIQKLTTVAVTAMEEGTGEVEQGAWLAFDAGNALKEILDNVEETYRQVQNISAAAEQISASSQEVVKAIENVSAITEENNAATQELSAASSQVGAAMENIASITQETSAAAQEVSASAEQMTVSIGEISAASEKLVTMAEDLRQMVARFRL